jgi:hypothetical protein
MKPEKLGFKLRKQITGTITDSKARRLFENTINTANKPKQIYKGTLISLYFILNIRTIMILLVIDNRQAKILGFNNVPTGYGAPCDNCKIPAYASLNVTSKRRISVMK